MPIKTSRTRLNDLDGKTWVKSTKSVWMDTVAASDRQNLISLEHAMEHGVLISESPPRDELKKHHPATFSEHDIAKLIRFFTKSGELVLDPFLGSGSSAIASMLEGRHFIGIELYPEWETLAKARIEKTQNSHKVSVDIRQGDSLSWLTQFDSNFVDFVVTSPPYWGILDKKDHKAKTERVAKGLATHYGNHESDLSNVSDYTQFLDMLGKHVEQYYRVLKPKKICRHDRLRFSAWAGILLVPRPCCRSIEKNRVRHSRIDCPCSRQQKIISLRISKYVCTQYFQSIHRHRTKNLGFIST